MGPFSGKSQSMIGFVNTQAVHACLTKNIHRNYENVKYKNPYIQLIICLKSSLEPDNLKIFLLYCLKTDTNLKFLNN